MHGNAYDLGQFLARSRDRLDGGATLARRSCAGFALDKNRLLDATDLSLRSASYHFHMIDTAIPMQLSENFSRVISAAKCRIGASDIWSSG